MLLPRLRAAPPETVARADGFSCRTQTHELDSGGHEAAHIAELVAAAYDGQRVDAAWLRHARPAVPSRAARAASTWAAAALAGLTASVLARAASKRLVGALMDTEPDNRPGKET